MKKRPTLTPEEIAARREALRDALANAAIEGFYPDEGFLALTERFTQGEITIEEAIAAVSTERKPQ